MLERTKKIDPEPKFHVPRSSNGKDYGGQPKRGQFLTLDHMGTPLKIKISKIGLRHVLSWPKLGLEPKFHESGTFGGFGKRAQSFIQYPADF